MHIRSLKWLITLNLCLDTYNRWEDLGHYDLPAMVDYILRVTGQKKLSYVGFSLGCTVFYVGANLRPELNDKVEVMISLGPTARVKGMDNVFSLVAPFSTPLKVFMSLKLKVIIMIYFDYVPCSI